ncbi:hypothetical protein AADZ90_000665 [Aestuariibius sp. 2305UL40-4]
MSLPRLEIAALAVLLLCAVYAQAKGAYQTASVPPGVTALAH